MQMATMRRVWRTKRSKLSPGRWLGGAKFTCSPSLRYSTVMSSRLSTSSRSAPERPPGVRVSWENCGSPLLTKASHLAAIFAAPSSAVV